MEFLDRENDIKRITNALARDEKQFIVLYGRRRIGKSTMLRHVLSERKGSVYFLSDQTSEMHQRMLFAKSIATTLEGFDKVTYPDWETLFEAFNRQLSSRVILCIDEFPYLVKSCASLPSVLQKLLNTKQLKFDLILCGSSQQLMHGYVLDRREPLYGLAHEIIRLQPIPTPYIMQALGCNAVEAIEEYAVWGGIPRYWELRAQYPTNKQAILQLLLDPQGILHEEPVRLLRDDMRDTVQASTLLSVIGNGANRVSEIAGRVGKESTALSEPLANLRELGYVRREVPYGESVKNSKKSIYSVQDPLFRFYYRFIAPYNSLLELQRFDMVEQIIDDHFSKYVSICWEQLCRDFVSGREIDGHLYGMASRWWGKIFDNKGESKQVELDVVAESLDKRHVLIAECKWTTQEDADRLYADLVSVVPFLPFIKKGQKVHFAFFVKNSPIHANGHTVFLPSHILI